MTIFLPILLGKRKKNRTFAASKLDFTNEKYTKYLLTNNFYDND